MSGIRALLLLVSFVLPATSGAATVYQYVGNTFSIVTDGVPDSVNRMSGFLRFDGALAPNLVNASSPMEWGVNLLAWEISDGLTTASEIDGLLTIDPPLSGGAPRLSPLELSTDDDGAIIAWQFRFGTGLRVDPVPDATGVLSGMVTRWTGTFGADTVEYCRDPGCTGFGIAQVANSPGTWSVVPVPAAVWLLGSALLGVAGLKRKNWR